MTIEFLSIYLIPNKRKPNVNLGCCKTLCSVRCFRQFRFFYLQSSYFQRNTRTNLFLILDDQLPKKKVIFLYILSCLVIGIDISRSTFQKMLYPPPPYPPPHPQDPSIPPTVLSPMTSNYFAEMAIFQMISF